MALWLGLALGLVCLAAAQQKPVFSSQYELRAVMSLPYANITEPLHLWYDAVGNRQRIEYYGALNTDLFLGPQQVAYKIAPMDGVFTCFETDGPVDLQNMFPDLTNFSLVPGVFLIDGIKCFAWESIETRFGRGNNYTFYVSVADSRPIRYTMMGYDSLLGSHFDEYNLTYIELRQGSQFVPDSQFQHPNMTCGPFPGPGNGLSASVALPEGRALFRGRRSVTERMRHWAAHQGKPFSAEEHERHGAMGHFARHWSLVEAHNRRPDAHYRLRLNHFADLSHDVLRLTRGRRAGRNEGAAVHQRSGQALPTSFDWRDKGCVTPVKDQGICGSCWSFGSTGVMEGDYCAQKGRLPVLSEQNLIDCTWNEGNNGCDGGEDWRSYAWVSQHPLELDDTYGHYLMADGMCHYDANKGFLRITGFVNVSSTEADLMDAIYTQGPISVGMNAAMEDLSFYDAGVYDNPACTGGLADLDHAVLAVGWGTSEEGVGFWIVKNSWSTHYGRDGYMYIARAGNICGITTQPTYPILA